MLTLQQVQAMLPGSVLVGCSSGDSSQTVAIGRVHSDTRTLRAGDLFVALRGERFDAHDFLPAARAAGAVAALAERGLGGFGAEGAAALPGVQVADTLRALQLLAAEWRARYTLPLIGVTGSNGKTTVTQMVAAILRAAYGADAAFATEGNLNNHIGVPLTLLRLRAVHEAGVVELGMNHAGEIAQLAAMARPTVVLVNNAQREHQEFMADVAAVARENGSAITALPAGGTAVFPAGDAHTPLWRALAGARRTMTFALDDNDNDNDDDTAAAAAADVSGSAVRQGGGWALALRTPAGDMATTLAAAGRHNAVNALAAAACALAVGVPLAAVARGIAAFRPVAGRSQTLRLRLGGRELTLVDDSYNANPDSVLAAIDVLAALPAPRWLLLGDMGEVGSRGAEFHAEAGAHASRRGIETVWTAGSLSAHAGAARHFDSVESLLAALTAALQTQQPLLLAPLSSSSTPTSAAAPASLLDSQPKPAAASPASASASAAASLAAAAPASVLVKGSRFMRMERVVVALQAAADAQAAAPEEAA